MRNELKIVTKYLEDVDLFKNYAFDPEAAYKVRFIKKFISED